jgi:hypothetical protein
MLLIQASLNRMTWVPADKPGRRGPTAALDAKKLRKDLSPYRRRLVGQQAREKGATLKSEQIYRSREKHSTYHPIVVRPFINIAKIFRALRPVKLIAGGGEATPSPLVGKDDIFFNRLLPLQAEHPAGNHVCQLHNIIQRRYCKIEIP